MLQKQEERTLPNWEQICATYREPKDSDFAQHLAILKQRKPGALYRAYEFYFRRVSWTPAWRRMGQTTWAELVDILYDQSIHSAKVDPTTSQPVLTSHNTRHYSQQPCTEGTLQARVEKAASLAGPDDPILVVGDDDMVGPGLCRAGFRDVTSIDLDPRICQVLQNVADTERLGLRVLQHDIQETPPDSFRRPYQLVFLDPMYSLEGVDMFLGGAQRFLTGSQPTTFFLSLDMKFLFRAGLSQLPATLERLELDVVTWWKAFNAYPMKAFYRHLVRFFVPGYLTTEIYPEKSYSLDFFTSDAILLRRP